MTDDQIRAEIAKQINAAFTNLAGQLRSKMTEGLDLDEEVTLEVIAGVLEAAAAPN